MRSDRPTPGGGDSSLERRLQASLLFSPGPIFLRGASPGTWRYVGEEISFVKRGHIPLKKWASTCPNLNALFRRKNSFPFYCLFTNESTIILTCGGVVVHQRHAPVLPPPLPFRFGRFPSFGFVHFWKRRRQHFFSLSPFLFLRRENWLAKTAMTLRRSETNEAS